MKSRIRNNSHHWLTDSLKKANLAMLKFFLPGQNVSGCTTLISLAICYFRLSDFAEEYVVKQNWKSNIVLRLNWFRESLSQKLSVHSLNSCWAMISALKSDSENSLIVIVFMGLILSVIQSSWYVLRSILFACSLHEDRFLFVF